MHDPTQALVSFRHVKKTYDGETLVVKDLNLEIQKGEFLTLLGPSGSGKTTCLMMLAGFEYPTDGEIWLDGQLLNRIPPHKRNIGMVFQNYALFPHLTVAQNLEYPLKVRKMPPAEREARVKRALDMVGMHKLSKRMPSQLSGGQQQRVALARALVFNPRLVLMDEPLGALDKQLREHMQLELKALHEELGLTFVYVTHDQSEALTMSDRVAVFDQGVIQQLDTVDRLYESPTNLFVANFIGDNNRMSGTVVARNGDRCQLRLADGTTVRALNVASVDVGNQATAVTVIAAPFVVVTVNATLAGFNQNYVRASLSLGASPVRTFFAVTLPIIAPGVISGALFAFATSLDDVVITMFIAGPTQGTLPLQMFIGIRENITPTVAALASIFIVFSSLLLITMEWLRSRSVARQMLT